MSHTSISTNRMLLEMERSIRTLNREILNPEIPELTVQNLEPVMKMVARVRCIYLKSILELGESCSEGIPNADQITALRKTRKCYDELVQGTQALEVAIKRGYLDVEESMRAAS